MHHSLLVTSDQDVGTRIVAFGRVPPGPDAPSSVCADGLMCPTPAGARVGDEVTEARKLLRAADKLVVLSGAGLSTEAGIPDFRSTGGVWETFDPADFEYNRLVSDPAGFWRLRTRLMEVMAVDKVAPTPAHEALARASHTERYLGHVTQNIDGLLTRAEHRADKLIEIHGNATTVRCISCRDFFPHESATAQIEAGTMPPACEACGGVLKPGTILFGEMLDEDDLANATAWARQADVFLVVGSSLTVMPAAYLPELAASHGARLIIVNRDATPLDAVATCRLAGEVGDVIPRILE